MNEKIKFFVLWLGEFLSVIGTGITGFALSVDIYQKTGMASYYSLITLSTVAPSILIRPVAGALADKYSRRLIMIMGNMLAGSGIVLLFFLLHFEAGAISIVHICFCMIVSSIGTGLSVPAYTSCITLLIPEEFYQVASGMIQVSASAQYIISPLLAGILLPIMGAENVILLDAASFLIVILIVFWIKVPLKVSDKEDEKEKLLVSIKKGMKYLRDYKENVKLIIMGMLVNFFMGFLIVLIGPMILSFSTQTWLGIGESISALGMVAGSVLVMFVKLPKNLYSKIYSYVILMGIGYAMVGLTQNYLFIIVACITFFYSIPYINTYVDVVFRTTIEKKMQGRVYAIHGALVQAGYIVAYSVAGLLADYIFEPMFKEGGYFYNNLGRIFGTGEGRGIGLMFVICGICIVTIGLFFKTRIDRLSIGDEQEVVA